MDRIERPGELIRISLEISSLLDFRRPQHQQKGRISAWDVTTANGSDQQRLSSLAFQGPTLLVYLDDVGYPADAERQF